MAEWGTFPSSANHSGRPFGTAGEAGRTLQRAGAAQQDAVAQAAIYGPLALVALPILYVLFRWGAAGCAGCAKPAPPRGFAPTGRTSTCLRCGGWPTNDRSRPEVIGAAAV